MTRRIDSWRRLPIVALVILGGLMLLVGTAEADAVNVELACPTTIPATGGPLSITLTLQNRTATSKSIAKSGLVAHLGNMNLLGPFFVPLVRSLNPFGTQVVPYVTTSFPAGAAAPGSFVTLAVIVMDSANKPLGSNFCVVQVQ